MNHWSLESKWREVYFMDSLLTIILELPLRDRLQLVQDIWDSIYDHPELLPVTDAQQRELDHRLAAYSDNPSGTSWNELRKHR